MTDDIIKTMAAIAAWKLGRQEGLPGMQSVLFVIRNRMTAGWYDGDLLKNVQSILSGICFEGPDDWLDPREPTFQKVCETVDSILDGQVADCYTGGATLIFSKEEVDLAGLRWNQTATLGNMIFGKERNNAG